jgi:hypothetical protein
VLFFSKLISIDAYALGCDERVFHAIIKGMWGCERLKTLHENTKSENMRELTNAYWGPILVLGIYKLYI